MNGYRNPRASRKQMSIRGVACRIKLSAGCADIFGVKAKELDGKTHYQILGVNQDDPVDRIKQVYHDLARVYHPDSNFYDEIVPNALSAEEMAVFKIITASYNVLIDAEKRKEYDQRLDAMKLSDKLSTWDTQDDSAEQPARRPPRSPRHPPPHAPATEPVGAEAGVTPAESMSPPAQQSVQTGTAQPSMRRGAAAQGFGSRGTESGGLGQRPEVRPAPAKPRERDRGGVSDGKPDRPKCGFPGERPKTGQAGPIGAKAGATESELDVIRRRQIRRVLFIGTSSGLMVAAALGYILSW